MLSSSHSTALISPLKIGFTNRLLLFYILYKKDRYALVMAVIVIGGLRVFCKIWRGELSELSPLGAGLKESLYLPLYRYI